MITWLDLPMLVCGRCGLRGIPFRRATCPRCGAADGWALIDRRLHALFVLALIEDARQTHRRMVEQAHEQILANARRQCLDPAGIVNRIEVRVDRDRLADAAREAKFVGRLHREGALTQQQVRRHLGY